MNNIIHTKNAPTPIGPYSQAVLANNTLYLSGQIALNSESNELVIDCIPNETHQVMRNLAAVLDAANMDFSNLVKCSIFLSDMDYFTEVNEVYGTYFENVFPARETIQVSKLPMGVNIEISGIAIK